MGIGRMDEFCRDVVCIVLISGFLWCQVVDDFGVGLLILNKWVNVYWDMDVVLVEDCELV